MNDKMFFEEATGTEVLIYSEYHRESKKHSRLIPGIVVGDTTEGTMVCPRCKEQREGIGHGQTVTCGSCGLVMERWGNGLFIKG